MVDLILRHAANVFEMFFLIVYFSLLAFDERYSKHLPIPRFIVPTITSCRYYLCLSWIALFFASLLLFENRSHLLHMFGFICIGISSCYLIMYRGAIEVGRYKNCRRH